MITFRQQGDFSRLTRFLERAKEAVKLGDLDKYGQAGVAALAAATPVDSGLTAKSWSYKVTNRGGRRHDHIQQFQHSKWCPHCHHSAIRAWNGDRRLGTGTRLHQPCDPAYF